MHYFTNGDLPSNIIKIETNICGKKLTFFSDNGVFSKNKIDFGSRYLLETINISKLYGNILDIGCGYGTLGLTIAKDQDVFVTMTDVNKRALHLIEMTAKNNDISNYQIIESDCYSNIPLEKFDFIITNPPIRAGKKIVYDIVMNAKKYMKESSTLFIVIRKDQGAKSLLKDLQIHYRTEVLGKNKGFFVISCNLC